MQTILGASGQIGRELALSLKRDFTSDIRLVSRNPHRVNETDQLVKADLLDAKQTSDAVKGSSIVYLTAGLPMDTQLWVEQWPTMMRNVIRRNHSLVGKHHLVANRFKARKYRLAINKKLVKIFPNF
eukprot:TRINITY_DN4727_c0_g2_i1.p1 TRINITY_DN4727_c0_g2~~TRINITY_DN4727_c0_g2_i1.p1  ORF type:complete len:127 (+),score=8.20 TRINITY_DN4727_c0_g2_i1:36-416(+)